MSRFRSVLPASLLALLGMAQPCFADALAFVGVSNGTTAIIDTGSGIIVGTIPADGDAVALMPDGRRIFLSEPADNVVRVVDVATRTVVHTITGLKALGLNLTADGSRLWSAEANVNSVGIRDANSYGLLATVPVEIAPVCIAMSPDGQLAYVSNFGSGTISRVDVVTGSVLPGTVAVGGRPAGVVFHPSQPRAYVSNYANNVVQVIDTAASTVIATIPVGSGPDAIAVTPAGDRVFVANTVSESVSVIDTASDTVISTLPTGYPGGVAVLADGRAYALCGAGPGVCVIGSGNTITSTIPLPAYAYTYGHFIGPTVIAPDAPTAVTGAPGNGEVMVFFTPGPSDGGLTPYAYTVQVSPGGAEVSGTASPILVTGLTNGNPYSFTVRATNLVGSSAYSASSAPVSAGIPTRLANISSRMQVLTGDDVMIGGFVIGGAAAKRVAIVATGPSLNQYGISNALANPTLTLVRQSDQAVIASNDDWQSAGNAAQLSAAGFAPSNPLESAILVDLPPGAYTAIVSGAGGGTGVGIVAVYEVNHPEFPLINISTRGQVLTGNDVMIGGFIIQGNGSQTVAIVATGPSLTQYGIANALANPTLTLVRQSDQTVIASNDDWQTDANAAQLTAAGFAPSNPLESGILITLPPGAYTAVLSGVAGGTGVGIIGVYDTTP